MATKRIRPTLGKQRELEKKLQENYEALHMACEESNGWREKYREKEKEANFLHEQKHGLITEAGEAIGMKALAEQKLEEQTEALHDRCVEADGWREKYRELKEEYLAYRKANKAIDLKASLDKEKQENDILRTKLQKMYTRGLWQRITNKEV